MSVRRAAARGAAVSAALIARAFRLRSPPPQPTLSSRGRGWTVAIPMQSRGDSILTLGTGDEMEDVSQTVESRMHHYRAPIAGDNPVVGHIRHSLQSKPVICRRRDFFAMV